MVCFEQGARENDEEESDGEDEGEGDDGFESGWHCEGWIVEKAGRLSLSMTVRRGQIKSRRRRLVSNSCR